MRQQPTTKSIDEGQITLTVIGSGDAFGSGGRLNTCFHVKTVKMQFLIDCGATTLSGLKRNNIELEDIDTILITHFHGDHYGGLPYFLLECAVYGRSKPLTILSPRGCKERLKTLLDLLYPSSTVLEKLTIDFKEYQSNEVVIIEPLTVLSFPVIHTDAAIPHGLRISIGNKVISYSGDTEWTSNLVDLAKDADLFICECNFYKTKAKGHLDYQTLMSKIPLFTFERILLTHFDKEMLNNLRNITLDYAEDGKVIIIE